MVNYVISMQNYMKISVLQNNCTILLVFAPFATFFIFFFVSHTDTAMLKLNLCTHGPTFSEVVT